MIWDSFLRFLTDLGWFAGIWIGLVVAFRLGRLAGRRLARSRLGWWVRGRLERRRQAPRPSPPLPSHPPMPDPPAWAASLLVRPDGNLITPSIQLRGPAFLGPARVRLEVIDEEPRLHLVGERDVADPDIGTELCLAAFPVPEDRTVEDVLSWVWRLVLEVGGEDRVLVVERLRPLSGLTREAELGARDDAAV